MDSSDGERSRSSDGESPQGSVKLEGSHSFNDDRPGRVLLRPWLEGMLESGTIEGLQWIDREKTMFKVPWKHRSKKDWSTRHSSVFLEWAKNTGRWNKGDPTPNYAQLKTRLRCAFNKAPDIEEMKGFHSSQGEEPYKVYRFRNKKECLAQKLKALNAKHISKGYTNAGGNTAGAASGIGNLWEIKRERCEEEMVTEVCLEGVQDQHILSFKDGDEENGDRFQEDIRSLNQNDADQSAEQKFIPSVIPLTVEMFSSSFSDESDIENEGSRRLKSSRARSYTTRSQKQQDAASSSVDLQNVSHVSQAKGSLDVAHGVTNASNCELGGSAATFAAAAPSSNVVHSESSLQELEGKKDLDFFRVASLFVEAGKILQKNKEPLSNEVRSCIKQEIIEGSNSEDGIGLHHKETSSYSNGVESNIQEKRSIKVVQSPNPFAIGSAAASMKVNAISATVVVPGYPPRLPKLVPLSSLKNLSLFGPDSRGTVNGSMLSQLPKIRMMNASILNQISKSPVRFSPSPSLPTQSSAGSVVGFPRPDSHVNVAGHFQPKLFFLSSNSFPTNFQTPAISISRPTNPENSSVKIVLSKLPPTDSVSLTKDLGIGSQSLPSLIMLSSAAEVAESGGAVSTTTSAEGIVQSAKHVMAVENSVVDAISSGTTTTATVAAAVPSSSVIATTTTTIVTCSIPPQPNSANSVVKSDKRRISSDTQEEALDLSNSAPTTNHHKEQQKQQSPVKEICGKLEIVEATHEPNNTKEISRGKSTAVDDDGQLDVTGKLNEITSIVKEMEESEAVAADPKLWRNVNKVIDLIRSCSTELNQWQKSLTSQKDVIHWRMKLVESEEEKIQLKAKCLGVSLGGELQIDAKAPEALVSSSSSNCFGNSSLLSQSNLQDSLPDSKSAVYSSNVAAATVQLPPFAPTDGAVDLVKGPSSVSANKTFGSLSGGGGGISTVLSPKNVVSFGGTSGCVKTTALPQTALASSLNAPPVKSPKNLRVVNLNKSHELGIVYPVQQDRSKAQQSCSLAQVFSSSSSSKFGSDAAVASSPYVLGIQNSFGQLKVVKINRTPSTEGCPSGSWNLGSGSGGCIPSTAAASWDSMTKSGPADNELKCRELAVRDVISTTMKVKMEGEASDEILQAAKRFKSTDLLKGMQPVEVMEDQTGRDYDSFKNKWYSS